MAPETLVKISLERKKGGIDMSGHRLVILGAAVVGIFSCSGPQQALESSSEDIQYANILDFVASPLSRNVSIEAADVQLDVDGFLSSIDSSANPYLNQIPDKEEKIAFAILDRQGYDSLANELERLSCVIPTSFSTEHINKVVTFDDYYIGSSQDFISFKESFKSSQVHLDPLVSEDGTQFAFLSGVAVLAFSSSVESHKIDSATRERMSHLGTTFRGYYGDSWISSATLGAYLMDSKVFTVSSLGDFSREQVASACSYVNRADIQEDAREKIWARWVLGRLSDEEKQKIPESARQHRAAVVVAVTSRRVCSQFYPLGDSKTFLQAALSVESPSIIPSIVGFEFQKYTATSDF